MQSNCLSSLVSKVLNVVFFPVIWFSSWLSDRIALTTEELEIFEGLLEGAIWGGANFFLDRHTGEKRLQEVLKSCDALHAKLSKKWFPDIEGIFFLRLNLIKIKMRIHAILGQENEVDTSRKTLLAMGASVPGDVELQVQALLVASKPKNSWLITMVNGLSKTLVAIVTMLKK